MSLKFVGLTIQFGISKIKNLTPEDSQVIREDAEAALLHGLVDKFSKYRCMEGTHLAIDLLSKMGRSVYKCIV